MTDRDRESHGSQPKSAACSSKDLNSASCSFEREYSPVDPLVRDWDTLPIGRRLILISLGFDEDIARHLTPGEIAVEWQIHDRHPHPYTDKQAAVTQTPTVWAGRTVPISLFEEATLWLDEHETRDLLYDLEALGLVHESFSSQEHGPAEFVLTATGWEVCEEIFGRILTDISPLTASDWPTTIAECQQIPSTWNSTWPVGFSRCQHDSKTNPEISSEMELLFEGRRVRATPNQSDCSESLANSRYPPRYRPVGSASGIRPSAQDPGSEADL